MNDDDADTTVVIFGLCRLQLSAGTEVQYSDKHDKKAGSAAQHINRSGVGPNHRAEGVDWNKKFFTFPRSMIFYAAQG
ncbi:MAG: hypothetical protein WBN23_16785 [Woeseia sp.]